MKLSSKIVEILEVVFPSQKTFSVDLTKNDIDDWDSMSHLSLIVELEIRLDIKFTVEEIQNINSISDLILILESKNRVND